MDRPVDSSAAQDRLERVQQVVEDVIRRRHEGEAISDDDILAQHLDLLPELKEKLERLAFYEQLPKEPASENDHSQETPSLGTTIHGAFGPQRENFEEPLPESIGRYAIRGKLGDGGFGRVYLGYDAEQLQREVAIKVPRRDRIRSPADMEAFLTEARLVATLDHPHIVPVYDAGRSEDGRCFVVSKRIEGSDLRKRMPHFEKDYQSIAQLIATVAEALHYAHGKSITHRDIKPENILIDTAGQPYVADFGLALKDDQFGEGSGYAGTPVYWSPEQARGEGHRVDGRSDIFSLGVVLYELLSGKRPFKGSSTVELAESICRDEARPLRQIDDTIHQELERICLKALSKRVTERYTTAMDLADDLRRYLTDPIPRPPIPATHGTVGANESPVKIVPKGLRSFDKRDAGFFLELLPGPRDRDGLPESIRFWKSRIEETDPDNTAPVGLIYGPSGCGKSSLVKAGLLPHLSEEVLAIYVEATDADTEARLIRALRIRCPELPDGVSLPEMIASLRASDGSGGRKVLIVLDQFEQWLHAHAAAEQSQLVDALRQCDGSHVQAMVMVRDDFYLGANRFFKQLEQRLVEGQNQALVDLFDLSHARKVLEAFGRAYGTLSERDLTPPQSAFLDAAVLDLAEEGKVVSVRLAVFAQMMKAKPWTPASLRDVGGTEGVGVAFLDENFSSRAASASHRLHQAAACAVLKALLPDQGTNIKGQMKSHDELLKDSGYGGRPADFETVLGILDGELRLITPTEPDQSASDTVEPTAEAAKYYQLTHDYLVRSLREWLSREEKKTRRGRARLRLAERSALWNAKPEKPRLPALWEFVSILLLTKRRTWTEPQRRMMSAATRYFSIRTAAVAVLAAVLAWSGYEINGRFQAEARIGSLVKAGPDKVLETVSELEPYLPWAAETLQQFAASKPKNPDQAKQQLHARLALVATDDSQVDPLTESLLTASPAYVGVIRDALRPYKDRVVQQVRPDFRSETVAVERRLRAAIAMADYTTEEWSDDDFRFLSEQILLENPKDQPVWLTCVQRVKDKCIPYWEQVFANQEATDSQLLGAANAIAEFASDDPERIARLLTVATPKQYEILFPLIEANPAEAAKDSLANIAAALPPDDLSSVDRITYGQRRAGAGITLLRLGERESVLPTFDLTDDPEAVAQFIHRCRDRGVQAAELLECLRVADSQKLEPEVLSLARYALLLALAEYLPADIPAGDREQLIQDLADWYAHDPSSAVHGAAGWLLRAWGQDEIVDNVDQTLVAYTPDREWFTLAITVTSSRRYYSTEAAQFARMRRKIRDGELPKRYFDRHYRYRAAKC